MGSLGLAVAAAFAASDEFHQSFVPTRSASVHDVMLDVFGAIVGLAVAYFIVEKTGPDLRDSPSV